jgi:hypothetical protein
MLRLDGEESYGRFVERPFGGLRAGSFRERLEEIYSEG